MTENVQSGVVDNLPNYTFPRNLPADLQDPKEIVKNDWNEFKKLDYMRSHWERPHSTSAHWMVTFGDSPQLVALSKKCQKGLSKSGFDMIEHDALHLTVRRMAYWDDISNAHVSDLFASAAQHMSAIPEFSIDILPLAGSTGAVRLSVSPWGPLFSIFDHATTLTTLRPRAIEVFRPHIGVAYNNRIRPAGPVVSEVAKMRSLLPVRHVVRKIDLVKLSRVDCAYRWTTIETVPLAVGANSNLDE